MLISTHEGSFYIVQKYEDSPVCCKNYQNTFRFSKYFKFQLCWSSHWLVVHKMGLLQQRSLYPNLRFWCKTYEWQHSWQEHTLKFWQRNGPHCIPHFSCENNNSSGNQNSSKWFYLVLNPCTVLLYSLWARGKMHHCSHPVSCRHSVQSPVSKWVFVEQHTDQNTKWSACGFWDIF